MLESPIEPTVGRIVLVRGGHVVATEPTRELPAIVTRVWGRNCINVEVFGDHHSASVSDGMRTSVMFNDDVSEPISFAVWRWMPYQVAKAAEQQSAAPAEAK